MTPKRPCKRKPKRPKGISLGGDDFHFSPFGTGANIWIGFMGGEGGEIGMKDIRKLHKFISRFVSWAEDKKGRT